MSDVVVGRRMRVRGWFAVAAGVCLPGVPHAQMAGIYSGQIASGQSVTVTVGTDPQTNALAITRFYLPFSAQCRGSSEIVAATLGLTTPVDIKNRVASMSERSQGFIGYRVTFSADGTAASGRASVVTSGLDVSTIPPQRALLCSATNERLQLRFQGNKLHTR